MSSAAAPRRASQPRGKWRDVSMAPLTENVNGAVDTVKALIDTERFTEAFTLFASTKRHAPIEAWNSLLFAFIRQPSLLAVYRKQSIAFRGPTQLPRRGVNGDGNFPKFSLPPARNQQRSKPATKNLPAVNHHSQHMAADVAAPFGQRPLPISSLDVFMSDMQAHGVQPDAVTYKLMMDALSINLDFERVLALGVQMRAAGVKHSLHTLHCVMNAHYELKGYKAIKQLFYEYCMPTETAESGDNGTVTILTPPALEPQLLTYYLLLSALMSTGDDPCVWKHWTALRETFPLDKLDQSLFASYLNYAGTRAHGRMDEIIREYKSLKQANIRPTFAVLNNAIQLLTSSIIAGTEVLHPPASITISPRAAQKSVARSVKRAIALADMIDDVSLYGHQMNESLFVSVISAFAALNDLHRVVRFFQQFCKLHRSASAPVPVSIHRSLIQVHAAHGCITAMEGFYHELCVAGRHDDRPSLEAMIRGYGKVKLRDKIDSMLGVWQRRTNNAKLSEETRESLAAYYASTGELDAVLKLIDTDMLKASNNMQAAVIEACCQPNSALQSLFQYMDLLLLNPSATLIPSPALIVAVFRALHQRGDSTHKTRVLALVQRLTQRHVRLSDTVIEHACICLLIHGPQPEGSNASDTVYLVTKLRALLKSCPTNMTASQLTLAIRYAVTDMRARGSQSFFSIHECSDTWNYLIDRASAFALSAAHYDAFFELMDYQREVNESHRALIEHRMRSEFVAMLRKRLLPTTFIYRLLIDMAVKHSVPELLRVYCTTIEAMLELKVSAATNEQRIEIHWITLTAVRDSLAAVDPSHYHTRASIFLALDTVLGVLCQELLNRRSARFHRDHAAAAYEAIAAIMESNAGVPPDRLAHSINNATSEKEASSRFVDMIDVRPKQHRRPPPIVIERVSMPPHPPADKVKAVIDHHAAIQHFQSVLERVARRPTGVMSRDDPDEYVASVANAVSDARSIARWIRQTLV